MCILHINRIGSFKALQKNNLFRGLFESQGQVLFLGSTLDTVALVGMLDNTRQIFLKNDFLFIFFQLIEAWRDASVGKVLAMPI